MPPIQAHAQRVRLRRTREGNIATVVLTRPTVHSDSILQEGCAKLTVRKLAPCAVKVRANRSRPTGLPSFKGRSFPRNNQTAHPTFRLSLGSTLANGDLKRIFWTRVVKATGQRTDWVSSYLVRIPSTSNATFNAEIAIPNVQVCQKHAAIWLRYPWSQAWPLRPVLYRSSLPRRILRPQHHLTPRRPQIWCQEPPCLP